MDKDKDREVYKDLYEGIDLDQFEDEEADRDIAQMNTWEAINPKPLLQFVGDGGFYSVCLIRMIDEVCYRGRLKYHQFDTIISKYEEAVECNEFDDIFVENYAEFLKYYNRVIGGISDIVKLAELGLMKEALYKFRDRCYKK